MRSMFHFSFPLNPVVVTLRTCEFGKGQSVARFGGGAKGRGGESRKLRREYAEERNRYKGNRTWRTKTAKTREERHANHQVNKTNMLSQSP